MSTNRYSAHPIMAKHGTFWRCRHGRTSMYDCVRCGVWHPIRYLRAVIRAAR